MKKSIILSSLLLTSTISLANSSADTPMIARSCSSESTEVRLVLDEMTQRAKTETRERAQHLQEYLKDYDMNQIDLWLYNPRNASSRLKTISKEAPEATDQEEWLALRPGDEIYYIGVSGIKPASHSGTYVGNGLVFEKWSEGSPTQGRGVVVLNDIKNFGTAAEEVHSLEFTACCKKRSCIKKEPNTYRQIHRIIRPGNERLSKKAILDAIASINHGQVIQYNALYNNCITTTHKVSSHKKDNCLASALTTAHFTCQKTGPRRLRSCKQTAGFIYATAGILLTSMVTIAAALAF